MSFKPQHSDYLRSVQDEQHKVGGFKSKDYDDIIQLQSSAKRKIISKYDEANLSKEQQRGKGLLNDALNKLPLPELHLIDEGTDGKTRKASFCGPFTNLPARLSNFDPKTGQHTGFNTKPINMLDHGCYLHDLAYNKFKTVEDRLPADKDLEEVAKFVLDNPNSTQLQRANALLVQKIMQGKQRFMI